MKANKPRSFSVLLMRMQQIYNWDWVQAQVAQTIEAWHRSASRGLHGEQRRYSVAEQRKHENAYDKALQAVEREVRQVPRNKVERLAARERIVASFAQFCASALDLEPKTVDLLTNDFLPVGTNLARWARQFDAGLSMADIIQACRNAWTASGLQALLGVRVELTRSILGYSLLYPYSDNRLDEEGVSPDEKLRFSERFRRLLQGEEFSPANHCESALCRLVDLIETQYPRSSYPDVFDCLLAIHRAQEQSIAQLTSGKDWDEAEVLRVSFAKGGSSVVADACLASGRLKEEESRFAFEWGVLLQLGDDLQDLREDMQRGSVTLFSRVAALGMPLDVFAIQLLNFSETVGARMNRLPTGTPMYKALLKMSWRSLIIRAVADSHLYFSSAFVTEAECCSPFRFAFLRARQERLAARKGLYALLFDAFLEAGEDDNQTAQLPLCAKPVLMPLRS